MAVKSGTPNPATTRSPPPACHSFAGPHVSDRKFQPGASHSPQTRLVHGVKPLENAVEVLPGNPDPRVGDRDAPPPFRRVAQLDPHLSVPGGVNFIALFTRFRIAGSKRMHTPHTYAFGASPCASRIPASFAGGSIARSAPWNHVPGHHRPRLRSRLALLDLCQRQQTGRDVVQADSVRPGDLDELALILLVFEAAFQQGLRIPADRGEQRSEFAGDVCDKVPAHPLQAAPPA